MRDKLLEALKQFRDSIDFDKEMHLISDGLISSVDLVELICVIEETFEIEVPIEEILPVNFNNVDSMLSLIEKVKNS